MSRHKNEIRFPSRRAVLKSMGLAPLLLRPAPFQGYSFVFGPGKSLPNRECRSPFLRRSSRRLTIRPPPLWKVFSVWSLRVPTNTLPKNMPGKLSCFSNSGAKPSRRRCATFHVLAKSLDPSIEASALVPAKEITLRAGNGITISRRLFDGKVVPGRERFLREIRTWLGQVSGVETAEFEITEYRRNQQRPADGSPGYPL